MLLPGMAIGRSTRQGGKGSRWTAERRLPPANGACESVTSRRAERMMITSFMAFLGVSAVVIMTPGPDTAVTVRNTLLGGRLAGILTALGISTGQPDDVPVAGGLRLHDRQGG